MNDTDVIGYPDSGKIGARHSELTPEGTRRRLVRANFREEDAVEYWSGED